MYYPNGEDALYNWPYLAGCALLAGLAAVSLLRPDPLRLRAGARARAPVVEPMPLPAPVPAEPPSPSPAASPAGSSAGAEHRAG